MKEGQFIVKSNECIADKVMRMVLEGDTSAIVRPGQFVNIQLPGKFLRRPISVCDWTDTTLILVYKVVGEGTAYMQGMKCGETVDILTGLGNGYDMEKAGDAPLLIGGGVGVPPLYGLAKRLRAMGKQVRVRLGFNRKEEVMLKEEMEMMGCQVELYTMDGSAGTKGLVTDNWQENYTHYYTCGPKPMIESIVKVAQGQGQVSMEERMGCGFGICVGCSIQTNMGIKRVCKEGPVFGSEELRVKS